MLRQIRTSAGIPYQLGSLPISGVIVDVMNRFLPQKVIDAEDHVIGKSRAQYPIQFTRRREIPAKRFLYHHPCFRKQLACFNPSTTVANMLGGIAR